MPDRRRVSEMVTESDACMLRSVRLLRSGKYGAKTDTRLARSMPFASQWRMRRRMELSTEMSITSVGQRRCRRSSGCFYGSSDRSREARRNLKVRDGP